MRKSKVKIEQLDPVVEQVTEGVTEAIRGGLNNSCLTSVRSGTPVLAMVDPQITHGDARECMQIPIQQF